MTSAQVYAAQTLVELARERGEEVSPAILKIANAKRRAAAEPKADTKPRIVPKRRNAS